MAGLCAAEYKEKWLLVEPVIELDPGLIPDVPAIHTLDPDTNSRANKLKRFTIRPYLYTVINLLTT